MPLLHSYHTTMGCCRLLLLVAMLLNVAHSWEMMEADGGGGVEVEIQSRVTAVLGQEVYLRCLYRGNASIANAAWKRRRNSRLQQLAGFNNGTPFSHAPRFSLPASPTNLTVRVRASALDAQGEYICTFESLDEEFTNTTFLEVNVPPQTELFVTEEMDNGTHYQSVHCSANDGKPAAEIGWLIGGKPLQGDHFSVEPRGATLRNRVSSVGSVLRFPTHLQDESSVTCVVHHPTLAGPVVSNVTVKTFVAPRMSVQAEMRRGEGDEEEDYWRVSCVASGGRPEAAISLVTAAGEQDPQKENITDGAGISTYRLPVQAYEGRNVSCSFSHPKLPGTQFRSLQLPSFYVSGVRLLANNSHEMEPFLELEEGQSDFSVGLEPVGNVPRYAVFCQKEDASPLPSGVAVLGSALGLKGPVDPLQAGLYVCEASYYRHRASLRINITIRPAPVPPAVKLDIRAGPPGTVEVECLAASAVPAATVSWRLPEGVAADVSGASSTQRDGRHSVTGVLVLPVACPPQALTVGCVVHHPLFQTPESRNVTIPPCAPPNVSLSSRNEWRGAEEYIVAQCRVVSAVTEATIAWRLGDGDGNGGGDLVGTDDPEGVDVRTEAERSGGGEVTSLSTLRLPSSLGSGRTLTCEVTPGLQRHLHIPSLEAPVLTVSVGKQEDSALWQAVCDYQAVGVKANLSWVLPAAGGARGHVALRSGAEGRVVSVKLTYRFSLAAHEGRDLTCLAEYPHGVTENRTIRIPKYHIRLRVLNRTDPRLVLRSDVPGQRILLRVEGNVPTHSISCQSPKGSLVQMEGDALVFPSEVRGQDEGLYICLASFHHLRATVLLRVEVESGLENVVLICVTSALAAALVLAVVLWVFCKGKPGARSSKKRESITALKALVQPPCSPKESVVVDPGPDAQQYAHLVSYCIVSDVKSTV